MANAVWDFDVGAEVLNAVERIQPAFGVGVRHRLADDVEDPL